MKTKDEEGWAWALGGREVQKTGGREMEMEMEKGYLTCPAWPCPSQSHLMRPPPSSATSPQVKRHVSYGGPIEAVPGLASFRELGPSLFGSGTSTGQAFSSLKLIGEQGVRARAELEAGRGDASIEVMHLMRSNRIPAEIVRLLSVR